MAIGVYLDASVLVALFTEDALSAQADALLRASGAPSIVSDFAAAEFASAVARKFRSKEVSEGEARRAFANFDEWREIGPQTVDIRPDDLQIAATLMRRLDLSLRTPDAIHVAVAMRLGTTLATFDRRMASDATRLGVSTVSI